MTELERMGEFFDRVSGTYDAKMKESLVSFDRFYSCVASEILKTQDKINILDIGCGTGLELEIIFKRAPKADITGIDISGEMLNLLRTRYTKYLEQITLYQESYLTFTLGKEKYDYVISVMTLHHLLPEEKLKLYRRIKKALKPGGKYIEGDYIVSPEEENQLLSKYYEAYNSGKDIKNGARHFDIPCSLDTQKRILIEAGFTKVAVLLEQGEAAVYSASL